MLDHSGIPVEIWQLIIDLLSTTDHRICLFVSKQMHDLALSRLFRTTKIYFGAWLPGFPVPSERISLEDRLLTNLLSSMSWDILHRISTDPSFARVVKKLVVHSYAGAGPAIFERHCLMEALRALRHLRGFVWRGMYPKLPADIVMTLVESCPSLEMFDVSIPPSTLPSLDELQRLRSISFYWDFGHSTPPDKVRSLLPCEHLVEANAETLRELCVYGDLLWMSPIRVLRDLTHLELVYAMHLDNISLLFHHSVQLESLTIMPPPLAGETVFQIFKSDPKALPHLTSLKIINPGRTLTDEQIDAFTVFVQKKWKLRRLDLLVTCDWKRLIPVLSAVGKLEHLKVLGFQLESSVEDAWPDDLSCFREYLPPNLTALRLGTYILKTLDDTRWIQLFTRCANLRFLHFSGHGITWLTPHDFCYALGDLELISKNDNFMRVERVDDEVELSPPWSLRKVMFATVEDFGCADWEWVMRYHLWELGTRPI